MRMHSYLHKPDISMDKFVQNIFDPPNISHLIPIKHGLNLETEAKNSYISLMRRTHRGFKARECGIFIDPSKPYIGATPDMVVSCECCGEGLLEVKCPLTSAHQIPTAGCPAYLYNGPHGISLQRNHSYYTQILGQMAVSRHSWCDFFCILCAWPCFREDPLCR